MLTVLHFKLEWSTEDFINEEDFIWNKKAVFYLSEIMAIEKEYIVLDDERHKEKENAKPTSQETVKNLFEEKLKKIQDGKEDKPHYRNQMAKRILSADKEGNQSIQKLSINRIERLLSDCGYKYKMELLKKKKIKD
jgi:hypothetical protein